MSKEENAIKRAYLQTFSSDAGQKVIEDMELSFGGDNYLKSNGDPYRMAYYEGQRAVLLRIKSLVEEAKNFKFLTEVEEDETDELTSNPES